MEQATPFLTIFGGTGDLVKVKIAKAITTLFEKGYLTDDTVILGVAFDDISETEYRQFWQDSVYPPLLNGKENPKTIPDQFLNRIFYKKVGFDVDADFDGLKLCIDGLTREAIDYNRMFYYAVWSDKYVEIARNLSEKGIISTPDTVCSHYLEKPIGNDLISAENCLNGMLNYVDTNNLFLIDHYLGKEAVRDLLVLLFENLTTYPILTAKYVERVVIHAYEAIGVEDRGRGYDSVGALRDMWIPHLLQILALFAMDRPDNIEDIPTKKREALEKVIRIECNEVEECAVFGQYSDGVDDEDELTAYRQEDDVDSKSLTETYVKLSLHAALHIPCKSPSLHKLSVLPLCG